MSQSVTRISGGMPNGPRSSAFAPLHQHSELQRGIMLDWLQHCDEMGEPHPSNEAIAGRFSLPIEAARTLLADLADRGEIRITYARGERQITLAPTKPKRDIGTPRMLPASVRTPQKPRISEEECFARIKRTLGRGAAPAPAEPQPVPPTPAAAPEEAPMPAPAPPPVQRREGAPAQTAHSLAIQRGDVTPHRPSSAGKRLQINISPRVDIAERVIAMAAEEGVSVSAKAREIFERAMLSPTVTSEEPVALTGKPMVPAAVLRSANAAGADLHDFCSTLLRIGLAAYDRGER